MYEGIWGRMQGREGDPDVLHRPEAYAPFPYRRGSLAFVKMDGRWSAFRDGAFDITYSLSSIEHFGGLPGAVATIREMTRVLRPGGILALATEYVLSGPPLRLANIVRFGLPPGRPPIRRRSTAAAKSGSGMRLIDASVLGRSWRWAPLPFRCTTVPLTLAIIPDGKSSMSQGRNASTSPGRMAVPNRISMMSRTWPSGLGPGRPGSLRHVAAALRIAVIWSIVSACGVGLALRSWDVPSTGLRAIES
jgi:SAM-dependent methyltransferase